MRGDETYWLCSAYDIKNSSHPIIVPRFELLRSTPIIFKDKLNHYRCTFFFSFLTPLNRGKNAVRISVLALLIYWGHYYLEIESDRTTIKITPSKYTNIQLHAVISITQLQGEVFLLCLQQTKIVDISSFYYETSNTCSKPFEDRHIHSWDLVTSSGKHGIQYLMDVRSHMISN